MEADPKLNLSEEVEASQIPSVAVFKSSFPNVGLNLKEKIQNNRVETDEPHEHEVREQNATVELDVDGNKQVGETHDTQQSKRINKRKKNDTQQTKYTPEPRKTTYLVWKFFDKVQENGEVHAKCPVCNKELCAKSRNGTTSLHRHSCFKDWNKDEKQQSVSNVESSAKANPKNKASPNIGAGAPPQAKRRKLVANVGEEIEEEETSSACIGQAAVSGLAHDQVQELTVQEDNTAKETLEEVSRIRSIISYLAVLLSRYQLKLRVLANKPTSWPLMVLEEFLKLNALRWSLLQKVTPSSTSC
ncbi:uncharacterized protein [Populus alba]|uniref:uncharacterized protein isoform X1 n=1 Tax=Populus alba TaxID=43335 RepID=UPI001589AB78|nr:uncharacterized protein LOC118030309 [Populus alba]